MILLAQRMQNYSHDDGGRFEPPHLQVISGYLTPQPQKTRL